MIACGIFVIAGIISWQNVSDLDKPDGDAGFFGICAFVCWTIAGLLGAGVIGQS